MDSALSPANASPVNVRLGRATYDDLVFLCVPPRRLIYPHTVLYEPNPIDLWLIVNEPDAYRNVLLPGYLMLDDVPFDQVLCTVILEVTETPRNGFLERSDTYTLYFRASIPESSGLPSSALISPQAIFGCYEGYCFDSEAPLWTGRKPGLPLLFRQPRGAVAELFHGLSIWAENLAVPGLSQEMFEWAQLVATGTPAEIRIRAPLTPQMLPPTDPEPFRERRGRRRRYTNHRDSSPTPTK